MERHQDPDQNSPSDDQQMVKNNSTNASPEFAPVDLTQAAAKTRASAIPKSPRQPLFAKFAGSQSKSLAETKPKRGKPPKWFKWVGLALGIILVISLWLGIVTYRTVGHVRSAAAHGGAISGAIESRNLALAKEELNLTKEALVRARSSYRLAAPLKLIPVLGWYVSDVDHAFNAGDRGIETGELVISALEPYADVLGFSGATQNVDFQSAEERVIFLATTVEKLAPQMDEIGTKLKEISAELDQVDERRYPKKLGSREIRPRLTEIKNAVRGSGQSVSQFQPFIKLLPDLLGNPEPRRYLLLFQNDAELRPTGGFMTAYASLDVLKGKIEPGVSEDIYTLDNNFKGKVPAPDPIKKYLPLVYNWNLRDMNLSPDFKISMDTFTQYYKQVLIAPEVDAVIAIDTEFMVRILRSLGPIGVPGFGGKFSADNDPRCDCPQVIYELENIITRPTYEIREGRKSILGPLMNSMLANMMGSPKTKWAEFFTIFTDSVREKHILMYFYDADKQAAAESLGAAGRINSYHGDYLHINDTNFAGAKSNLFVEQEVVQEISVQEDGSYTKKLTLTYRNPAPPSNCNLEAGQLCLNGILRDWMRIYVPKGAKLTAARGFELDMGTGEDLGHTVFDGFFTLSPQSVKKLEIEYTVPAGLVPDAEFKILIQKQPGIDPVKHSVSVNGSKAQVYTIDADTELSFPRK